MQDLDSALRSDAPPAASSNASDDDATPGSGALQQYAQLADHGYEALLQPPSYEEAMRREEAPAPPGSSGANAGRRLFFSC